MKMKLVIDGNKENKITLNEDGTVTLIRWGNNVNIVPGKVIEEDEPDREYTDDVVVDYKYSDFSSSTCVMLVGVKICLSKQLKTTRIILTMDDIRYSVYFKDKVIHLIEEDDCDFVGSDLFFGNIDDFKNIEKSLSHTDNKLTFTLERD